MTMGGPDGDGLRAARAGKARAELAQSALRTSQREKMLRRWSRNGSFAIRKTITTASSGQVVIPKEALDRWALPTVDGVNVLLLDLQWGVLVIPEAEAATLISELNINDYQLRRRGLNDAGD
jgi:hypothetical protein